MRRRELLDEGALEQAAQALAKARYAIALTGAGMSVESGIPDFRSEDGLWNRFPPDQYATLSAFNADPARCWAMLRAMLELLRSAEPNAGHLALAELERAGRLQRIVTQNIDGLHTRAGSREPVEVHGTWRGLRCPTCGFADRGAEADGEEVPTCPRCYSPMKPPVVLFEESLPAHAMGEAWRLAQRCDLMLVIGTSLAVQPIASLPQVAAARGVPLVEIDLEPGHLREHGALELAGGAAGILPRLAARVLELSGNEQAGS
ncbi:MAG: NAD-dependent deacylase [Pseudomonadota bacterium]